ncbi:MAG TPA: glycosyltransferase family 4 protein, partial [Roseivirga sp.]
AIHSLLSIGVQVKLRVAGSGTELQRLEELVKELNLDQQIEFLGQIDAEELLPFYHSLDAYIHASNGETQCYSILEAQACGLPILASNVIGIKEFIKDQEEGILFANNVSSISNSIQTLIKNLPLRRHLAQQSRKLALRESTNNNLSEQLYRILSE